MELPPIPDDFIDRRYAVKHGVALWLRIYPAEVDLLNDKASGKRPWLFWTHGGAYCSGQHYQVRSWLLPLMASLGVHVVSCAYRLTPVVSLEEMLEDCQDAYEWCRANLSAELGTYGRCDIDRFAIGGDSSGGSLAALLALRLQTPRAVLNVYGVTDLVAQQAKYDDEPPHGSWDGGTDEIEAVMGDRDPAHAVTATTNAWNLAGIPEDVIEKGDGAIALELKAMWKVCHEEWVYNERVKNQWDVKKYIGYRQSMVKIPLRLEGMPEDEQRKQMEKYSLPYLLKHVSTYSPTVFLHGTGDQAVPVEESRTMAKELRRLGVPICELYCPGEDHGWDNVYIVRLNLAKLTSSRHRLLGGRRISSLLELS